MIPLDGQILAPEQCLYDFARGLIDTVNQIPFLLKDLQVQTRRFLKINSFSMLWQSDLCTSINYRNSVSKGDYPRIISVMGV